MNEQKLVDRDALTAALKATLKVHDAGIGWGLEKDYHYGEPPSVDQIVAGIWVRLDSPAKPRGTK